MWACTLMLRSATTPARSTMGENPGGDEQRQGDRINPIFRGFLARLGQTRQKDVPGWRTFLGGNGGELSVGIFFKRITTAGQTVAFYWVKLNSAAKHDADFFTGLGYWTRANPEQCLLATGGKPMRHGKDVRRLVVEKRREHSRKPDCVRERIERLVAGPYLELFSRETKQGWECWGNQVTLFDNGTVSTRRQPSRN